MKPGCLIKSLIVSTIIIAVIAYILINKYDEYVLLPARDFIISKSFDSVNEMVLKLQPGANTDSLQKTLALYKRLLESQQKFNITRIDSVADSLIGIMEDKVISDKELQEFSKFIERQIEYEKRQKN